jgi:hypothetical protein
LILPANSRNAPKAMARALTSIAIAIFFFLDLYDDSVQGTVFLLFVLDSRPCAKAGGKMPTL